MRTHRLAEADLDALATGLGGPALVGDLLLGQRSRRLLLLKLITERSPGLTAEHRHALAVLGEADRHDPRSVAALVDTPMFGSWCGSTLGLIAGGAEPWTVERQLDRIVPYAAVAAHRAGIAAELLGRVHSGTVLLPTLGLMRLATGHQAQVKFVSGSDGIWVDGREAALHTPGWQPLRVLRAPGPPAVAVPIDDLDPGRDSYHIEASPRLTSPTVARWQQAFAATWQLVARHLPERAAELSVALRTVVPLRKPDLQAARSATAREAVGAVGLDLPLSHAEFATTLVHEIQHSKLTAVMDIEPLCAYSGEATWFAPWRTDPRPLAGLLQGIYAFLGVADTWRALYTGSDGFPEAPKQFARARADVTAAVEGIGPTDELTPAGRRFVAGMAAAVDRLGSVSVPRSLVAEAETRVAAKRVAWRRHRGLD
ncbi:uncharacterized protein SAMN05421812_114181 [Asanoa hainanensis]|uniref:HEXXH motif-containing protein n=1 Tax=Asanoa hainanensis TaxID=560556 RepID=A0A239P6U9_9ACTN|nr:HEXXH motif-containing putative peptide modification protein [Asanoa hainanensis]SNT62785.1 uncharacterized protein SAMN05421812_114181 [Asanoa hainanensis]